MTASSATAERLLALLHRIGVAGLRPPEAIGRDVAVETGDTVAVFKRGSEGGQRFELAAVCDRHAEIAQRWRTFLEAGGLDGALLFVQIIGQSHVLDLARDARGETGGHALLVPMRAAERAAGILVLLRGAGRAPFDEPETMLAEAIAAQMGLALRARSQDRLLGIARAESDLLRGSLHILGGQVDADVALQPLAVQARQAVEARSVCFLSSEAGGGSLRLVAGAGMLGCTCPAACPLADHPLLERPYLSGTPRYTPDLSEQAGPVLAEPLCSLLVGAGAALAMPMARTGRDPLGVALFIWPAGAPPLPEQRTFAAHVTELAALLLAHANLSRQAGEARAGERLAAGLATQRDSLVRQIVHDLRNAVHVVGLATEELEMKAGDPARARAALEPLARQAEFMAAYLERQLRSLDATSLDAPPPAKLEAALAKAEEGLGKKVTAAGRQLRVGPCEPAALRIPQVQLGEILAGLVEAAVPLAEPGTELELWAAVADGWCTIVIEDDGPGLSFEAQQALLRAPGSRASGGLPAVRELVAAAGGHFGIQTRPGGSTSFHVGLPTVDWGVRTLQ
ncbi:MAG: GAF domain-containing sensor histidine kinase [Candidatus Sericytochromatia bacterium]|nr:GAF domain-containing sensor histidine kinase [Candidatus Tanganyikabacteria bacterium]